MQIFVKNTDPNWTATIGEFYSTERKQGSSQAGAAAMTAVYAVGKPLHWLNMQGAAATQALTEPAVRFINGQIERHTGNDR